VNPKSLVFGDGELEFFGRQHPIRSHNQLQSNHGSADPHAGHCTPVNGWVTISCFRGYLFRSLADKFKAPHKCPFDRLVLIKLVFAEIACLFFQIASFGKNMTKLFKRRE